MAMTRDRRSPNSLRSTRPWSVSIQPGTRAAAGHGVAAGRADHLGVRAAPERPLPRWHAAHRRRRRVQHRTRQGRSARTSRDWPAASRASPRRARSMITPCTSRRSSRTRSCGTRSPHLIISERWAEAHDASVPADVKLGGENYASRHANGTGPFILKEFEPNGRAVMVRNPDWWGTESYPHNIDRIEYTPIPDPEARLAALVRGDLDLLTDLPIPHSIGSRPRRPEARAALDLAPSGSLDLSRAELAPPAQGPQSIQRQARPPGDLSGDRHRSDP